MVNSRLSIAWNDLGLSDPETPESKDFMVACAFFFFFIPELQSKLHSLEALHSLLLTADTSSTRATSVWLVVLLHVALFGLSLILFSQSSMSRQQLMSISSLTAKFACKFTYFAYFAYTAYISYLFFP